ncbi:MAG: hypothetical protein MJK04_21205, partial [Psychrosphaera sp.]|nr:hypothetical protein [Psychrosphaera sp.]
MLDWLHAQGKLCINNNHYKAAGIHGSYTHKNAHNNSYSYSYNESRAKAPTQFLADLEYVLWFF